MWCAFWLSIIIVLLFTVMLLDENYIQCNFQNLLIFVGNGMHLLMFNMFNLNLKKDYKTYIFWLILDIDDRNMTNRRHCFDYRRRHPELFPFYCESCVPQRRFKLPPHKAQHDKDKHGITTSILSHNYPQGATFSALTLHSTPRSALATSSPLSALFAKDLLTHPPPRSVSATSSPLSALSARELNTFVQTELEPDTEYNKSCNAVVDRLCQFMQNNFPDVIRPSEVRKVNIHLQK